MKLGVMSALFSNLKLIDALDYCQRVGLDAIELPAGAYPGDPWNLSGLHRTKSKLTDLREMIADRDLEISGIAVHGNAIHPNKKIANAHHKAFTNGVRLAQALDIDTVITFSGCPGGSPSDKRPNWVTCPWPDDYSDILAWQWEKVVIPYWKRQAKFARDHGVKVAFEAHPGFVVYNTETILKLRKAAGKNLGANLDPSHFFWQGIDPIESARVLGDEGALFYVHAKDTAIDPHNTKINGTLDAKSYGDMHNRSWVFRTCGYGHGVDFWKPFVSMLRVKGYDGVLSIEHEDSMMSTTEGFEKAVRFLRDCLIEEKPAEAWWFKR